MTPDRRKLRQKIHHVRESTRRLRQLRDEGRTAFLENPLAEPAATRLLQVAIEAILDAANHVVAREGWGLPKSYREAIDLLIANGVLAPEDRERFHGMVAFRDRAVHLYDAVDAEEVFRVLEGDLGDFDRFVDAVTERYFETDEDDVAPG